jgi:hypothetical protein
MGDGLISDVTISPSLTICQRQLDVRRLMTHRLHTIRVWPKGANSGEEEIAPNAVLNLATIVANTSEDDPVVHEKEKHSIVQQRRGPSWSNTQRRNKMAEDGSHFFLQPAFIRAKYWLVHIPSGSPSSLRRLVSVFLGIMLLM